MPPLKQIKRFEEAITTLFPGLNLSQARAGNKVAGKIIWSQYHYNIPPENSALVNSPYFHDTNSFLHFTSLPALESILQQKAIRLYNLHTLNDPREFTFASRMFKLDEKTIKDAKDNLFVMSFCENELLKKKELKDQFNMWRLYGLKGKGVCINFSISNDPTQWVDFHISKIIYGTDNRTKFSQLLNILETLNRNNPKISIDLGKICAFHKSKLFFPEKELRLLFDRRKERAGMQGKTISKNGEIIFPIIKSDLSKLIEDKEEVRYLEIPIYRPGVTNNDVEIPLLKIEKIFVGYNFSKETKKIIDFIEDICKNNLGYKPIIEQSNLRKYYWDINPASKP